MNTENSNSSEKTVKAIPFKNNPNLGETKNNNILLLKDLTKFCIEHPRLYFYEAFTQWVEEVIEGSLSAKEYKNE